MSLILMLIFAALVLVAFEVVLPGGILGVIAAICALTAVAMTYIDYGVFAAAGVFLAQLIAIVALIFIEFKLLAKTTLGKAFYLQDAVSGHSSPENEESLLGKSGQALTRLNPSGKVQVDGKSYEAHSQDGYLESGTEVTVVAQNNFKLTIQKL